MGRIFKGFDWLIFIISLILVGFSLIILIKGSGSFFTSQLIFSLIGFSLFFIFSQIDYKIFKTLVFFLFFFSLGLIFLTFFGPSIRGANRWIEFLGVRWQPVELVKVLLIIIFSNFFSDFPPKNFKILFFGLILIFPFLFFVFHQPDLGNALIIFGIWAAIIYAAGLPVKLGLASFFLISIMLPTGWFFLKTYQKLRILSFLSPSFDPSGAGYHSIQAMIAVGSGQVFGRGLGQGSQSQLLFLPEYQTDFIFATLTEELGILGGALVIFLYGILLLRILQKATLIEDQFGSLILIGIFTQLFLHIFINIGMNLGILPITGITLPLISNGGSSLVSILISLGIAVNVFKQEEEKRIVRLFF